MKKIRLKYMTCLEHQCLIDQNKDISWQYHSNKWTVMTVEPIEKKADK